MISVQVITDPKVAAVFENYPKHVRDKMKRLRQLIIEVADEIDGINELEESLKWGEPSFATRYGSPVRMDWKERAPDTYALYFNCSSRLVSTFREVFNGLFQFEGNRAMVFGIDDVIPENELKRCLSAALRYHKVKVHPMLGL